MYTTRNSQEPSFPHVCSLFGSYKPDLSQAGLKVLLFNQTSQVSLIYIFAYVIPLIALEITFSSRFGSILQ